MLKTKKRQKGVDELVMEMVMGGEKINNMYSHLEK
jgi:hypothetical protein